MTSALADELRRALYERIGAIFANTLRGPGHCDVCTAPTAAPLCDGCRDHRTLHGTALADLVVPLAYVCGWMSPPHQSAHHVRRYKHLTQPSAGCANDLRLMVHAATLLHAECVAKAVGSAWDTVTFVPSAARPGPTHPAVALARSVAGYHLKDRLLLTVGPEIGAPPTRRPMSTRFVVDPGSRPVVEDRHVLVVDDTWVSGGKAQSAALALKAAGARAVTVLCVGRWLDWRWAEHKALIQRLDQRYDAFRCPCPGAACHMVS